MPPLCRLPLLLPVTQARTRHHTSHPQSTRLSLRALWSPPPEVPPRPLPALLPMVPAWPWTPSGACVSPTASLSCPPSRLFPTLCPSAMSCPGLASMVVVYCCSVAKLCLTFCDPIQYSCLENPMDGGAWWDTVHGIAKSRTRLNGFTFTFHFHALEKEMATHSSILAWRIPGTEEPVGLPSMGLHRVGHD